MYKRELLIKDGLPPLETKLLNSIRKDYFEQSQKDCKTINYEEFTARFEFAIQSSDQNTFWGFTAFPHKDVIIGCQHYIDNLNLIKKNRLYQKNHIVIIHRDVKSKDNLEDLIEIIIVKKYGRSKIIFGLFIE